LLSPLSHFSGANLTNTNLTNANLTNTNLTNANLCGSNLTNAMTSGVKMIGANFTNVTGYTGTITMHNPTLSPSARISGNTMTTSCYGVWASVVIGMRLVGGRHYWAARVNKLTNSHCLRIGVTQDGHRLGNNDTRCGGDGHSVGFQSNNSLCNEGDFNSGVDVRVVRGTLRGYGVGQTVGLLLDQDTSHLSLYIDGQFVVQYSIPPAPYSPAFSMYNGSEWTLVEGAVPPAME
jgi:hypothetical protein